MGQGRELQRIVETMEEAHLRQAAELQRLQAENGKLDLYRESSKNQEKVIGKLERVLEKSLDEVQKAKQAEAELERLKMENARLRARVSDLTVRQQYHGGMSVDEEQELRAQLAAKAEEIRRLEDLVNQDRPAADPLEAELSVLRTRLEATEAQLRDNSRQFGKEISLLQVEVAKKDAQIMELEMRLG